MELLTEHLLPLTQRRILDPASNLIKKEKRAEFRKFVLDVLRSRRDPPEDTDVRHACGSGIVRYGRRI